MYSGWLKLPRRRWAEVCTADTSEECWAKLLAHRVEGACEKRVTPSNDPPKGATRMKEDTNG